ncbi:unnamed protein product [Aureobasidium uvarum]|uniref:Uncharacterized protein n=1 Tax=Aureobasidium uvarum TaxID=2773716 RepID=A0A9N8KQB1_9PEZI|nr:unnamed protein product [Aureobasidium uvarum]
MRDNVKGSRICETRDKAVLNAMTKHDKICVCGAFDFSQQKERKPISPKTFASSGTPTSSKTHTSSQAHTSPKTEAPNKSLKTDLSTKTPRISQSLKNKALAPRKAPKFTTKQLLHYQKEPFEDESDYDKNIFEGIPRRF